MALKTRGLSPHRSRDLCWQSCRELLRRRTRGTDAARVPRPPVASLWGRCGRTVRPHVQTVVIHALALVESPQLADVCPKAAGAGSDDPPDEASGPTSPGSAVSGCERCSQPGNYTDGKGPSICFSKLGGWGNRGNGEEERTQPQMQKLDQKTFSGRQVFSGTSSLQPWLTFCLCC